MNIYIDFDGTLYNTTKLNKNFIHIFNKYNINTEYIKKLMNNYKNYDILANKIIIDNNIDKSIYNEIFNLYSNNLVYKDVIPFLEKYYKKYELILLTLGNKEYQEKKIKSSNLKKYFKDIIITNKDKSKLNIDYTNGIFIDNNPNELKKFYNSNATYLIRIKRNEDKYSKLNLDIKNIPEFNSFKDLDNSNYLKKIGEIKHE